MAVLLEAVMRLPDHERNAVLLCHFQGHSVRDAAALTGRTVGTVTKQLSRAYARLRAALKDPST
jgi:DNA-directed RNA polymerase specialized sigma24 family protein